MRKKFKENRNLAIIALIAIVNALGYGIIIPVLYTYSQRYGLSDFQNGLLFAVFSLCQFLSTPIIGRMSDKYGRRPLLIASISGTGLSFLLMAFAPSAIFLFIARALDGITAGNIPVASAVVTDTTDEKNRAKGFGIIGASFGFGFIFGPAISAAALAAGYSESVPFMIAATISFIAVVITFLFLPETNTHRGEVKKGKLFDFKALADAVTDPNVGRTLLITLLYSTAFSLMIYVYQPFSVKVLNMTPAQISMLFTLFGIVGLISQIVVLPTIMKRIAAKHAFSYAILMVSIVFLGMFFITDAIVFAVASGFLGICNSVVNPLIQTILSEETDANSQGTMQGINASYMSIGQIAGPILGGAIATIGLSYPFLLASAFAFVCYILSFKVLQRGVKKESTF